MIEHVILKNLAYNEQYARKVLPFLKGEYFTQPTDRALYHTINTHYDKFNRPITKDALLVEIDSLTNFTDEQFKAMVGQAEQFDQSPPDDVDWLVEQTETFCKNKAVYNAISKSIQIFDGKTKQQDLGSIPQLLESALSISFDSHIGHDFIDDSEARYNYYHKVEEKLPFDIEYLNIVTKGGVSKKTLNIILAGTGVGKSLALCHFAAYHLTLGKNVLYITMEMAEEKIAERIDANLLNISLDELAMLPKDAFEKKINRLREKTTGKLIIKEYPTGSAGANNFRHLINELRLKKQFKPDVIYIDYLNICASSRLKYSGNVNSYTYIKAIAEELRGLGVECNVPVFSATQTTRSGFTNSDVGLEDTSESFGLPATADLMFALITSEELADLNQIMGKQLKNRYSDVNKNRRFIIGIDRSKMRLYNVEQTAQEDVLDGPMFDSTPSGERMNTEKKFKRSDVFEDFN